MFLPLLPKRMGLLGGADAETQPICLCCAGLVLARPSTPTLLFQTPQSALVWTRRGRRGPEPYTEEAVQVV